MYNITFDNKVLTEHPNQKNTFLVNSLNGELVISTTLDVNYVLINNRIINDPLIFNIDNKNTIIINVENKYFKNYTNENNKSLSYFFLELQNAIEDFEIFDQLMENNFNNNIIITIIYFDNNKYLQELIKKHLTEELPNNNNVITKPRVISKLEFMINKHLNDDNNNNNQNNNNDNLNNVLFDNNDNVIFDENEYLQYLIKKHLN